MITIDENSEPDMVNITISIHPSKINELGQLVDKLSILIDNLNQSGVKKAPAKVKKETKTQRLERMKKTILGR